MLPTNPLLQLTPLRARHGVARLAESIWSDPRPAKLEATPARPDPVDLAAARTLPRAPVRFGESWGRLYDQRWYRVTLPARCGRWLRWDEQGEATLYVRGEPYYGFDVAHRYCEIPAGVREVWVESLCVQAAIWHPDAQGLGADGNLLRGAHLFRRDEEAWAAYHDLNCLCEWMLELRARELPGVARELFSQTVQPALTDVSPLYRRLLRGIDTALDALDHAGVAAMRRQLARVYREMRDSAPLARAVLTGHSHLDLVWLWDEQTGEGKAVHTFANVDRLMTLYPEFRFAFSQPASFEAVGRRSPALARKMRAHMLAGRCEATGGMYVESDSHIACGEGLARSLILGQEAFARLRGRHSRILWLPDLFGFSACLPQLMKLGGVDYFFTTKTTWNTINRFPHSSFVWRGPGGHAVLSHVTQGVQFNNTVSVEQLRAASHQHQQGDLHDEFLMPTGWGDGGGGPDEEMCERARRLSTLRGLPELKWDHPEAFFDRLAKKRTSLPTLDGEIYLEYHRGTFTTHSSVKAHFRALERALQLREAVLVAVNRAPDPQLDHAWRRLVFAQFHDYIPGSSIPEVYARGLPELASLAREAEAAALAALTTKSSRACLFNPLPMPREVVVDDRVIRLPPLAGVAVETAPTHHVPPVVVRGRTLSNGRVKASVDARGHLTGLSVDGKTVALKRGAGQLVAYPDHPANFAPWDIDRHSLSLGQPLNTPATITVSDHAIAITRRHGQTSTATVRYALKPGESVLRITVELDWHETDTLLKMHFPTQYLGREARCGTAFGSVLRPQLATSREAEAMWEWPMSRWAAVSDDGERDGLFVVTQAKYGLSCRDGNVGLTLLRTPPHVGFEDHAKAYPAHLSRLPRPDTIHTDQGRHVIELAIGHYQLDAPSAEQPAQLAETLFTPVLPYRGVPIENAFRGIEDAGTLIPCWARPLTQDSWVLRLHEVAGQRGTAKLSLAPGWRARTVNLLGEKIPGGLRGSRLAFAPYEIISLHFTRQS